jgi:hypothetical protein
VNEGCDLWLRRELSPDERIIGLAANHEFHDLRVGANVIVKVREQMTQNRARCARSGRLG